jgi:hypothetical protein
MVVGYALLRDWRLISALLYPLSHWRVLMRKRKLVQAKRRVSDRELARWFSNRPASRWADQVVPPNSSEAFAKKM